MATVELQQCRICSNSRLEQVLDLGEQELTGVFPRSLDESITKGPLRLVKCVAAHDTPDADVCGLLQLQHSYDLNEMYGENYGYRSGLNQSMVDHLSRKVMGILDSITLETGDLIVDIGSNDATTLKAYPRGEYHLAGIDPTGVKFQSYYPAHIELIPEFFSRAVLERRFPGKKAKVVTSFSMFYDLEDPLLFMREVYEVLADEGVWVCEQSYLPTMLDRNAYDTACHEHLEYYAFHQIKWMADRVGFRVTDIEFNDINGGSFSFTARKVSSGFEHCLDVESVIQKERERGMNNLEPYRAFARRVAETKRALLELINQIVAGGGTVHALGASTKGNVLLQYCELTADDIISVGEVNREKFGRFTPGSHIPIVAENELLDNHPDYLLVLPWHFREFFLNSATFSGMKLIFPLPDVEIVEVP